MTDTATRQTKTADELQRMILTDLRQVEGCPRRGVIVTVYGLPWKAMLSYSVEAGPVRNKRELKKFFDIILERHQRLYDIA